MSDAARRFHETWLGMVQPSDGLVVSIPALIQADCFERQSAEDHRAFLEFLEEVPGESSSGDAAPATLRIRDTLGFLVEGLGWNDALLDREPPEDLSLYVPEGAQTIAPTAALRYPDYVKPTEAEGQSLPPAAREGQAFRILLWELPDGLALNEPETATGSWEYPPSKKFERLLRECRVPIGLLTNRRVIRLLYAPLGEASGSIDFRIADMAEVGGRPIFDALLMLLSGERIEGVAPDRQLDAILERSREMQAEVTTELSSQVFTALELLLRGFEAADIRQGGALLRPLMEQEQDILYEGLLTVLLRLVFLLYAEDSGLLPTEHPLFSEHYSLYALFERLEQERGQYPDAMNRRYSAWPQLLALFRAVYLGVQHDDLHLPAREGHLFDPHRFPFLEGFDGLVVPVRDAEERASVQVPTVDDETIYQVLRNLIYLGNERLSYRALYEEQVGSVYEALMGYYTLRIESPSVRIKPSDGKTAPSWLSVEELLEVKPAQRSKWLKAHVGLRGARAKNLLADLSALEKQCDDDVTELVEKATKRLEEERVKGSELARPGRVVIQPGDERKRTSSHYTPPSLSSPIVARTLEPLLATFGPEPSSEQILSLTVCDPAMGSGAFLVEACRYLGERLLDAWVREGQADALRAKEEDVLIYARRLVAERCLYGVDKNPFAVELAKLSLWLVTLQREKPFTFLDHNLRCGDSLVGCSFEQITAFHWKPGKQMGLFETELNESLEEAIQARSVIMERSPEDTPEANRVMRTAMEDADDALSRLRSIGDLLIGAYFSADKDKAREGERVRRLDLLRNWLDGDERSSQEVESLASETRDALGPFHWMIEFPEVFYAGRADPLTERPHKEPAYLDAVVGNPPFMGGSQISGTYGKPYLDWVLMTHQGAHGNGDYSAHFFRRSDTLLGQHGTIGLIATNTIAQGDTRSTGLQLLVGKGLCIYDARESIPWPGDAAVTVSVLHLAKGEPRAHVGTSRLNNAIAPVINSRLRPKPERADPARLAINGKLAFVGAKIYGQGFILTPDEREQLIENDRANAERIFPYIGGQEVNTSPTQDFERYVINFGTMALEDALRWPDLVAIVRERVKPHRDARDHNPIARREKRLWWLYRSDVPETRRAIAPLDRCLVNSAVSKHLVFAWQPTDRVFAHTLYAYALAGNSAFAVLQSRIHERWARLLSSSLEDRLRYTASDCFDKFPFPEPSPKALIPELEDVGKNLYATRAQFMVDTDQGLTKIYNALVDPTVNEPRVEELRQLHIEMDQAVLAAYAEHTGD
ncbi:MAG: N-6 DNA methylase, partial [Myxococcales bacterium]|nr:N-6 DNA methylase [Myxococcales bacterium]